MYWFIRCENLSVAEQRSAMTTHLTHLVTAVTHYKLDVSHQPLVVCARPLFMVVASEDITCQHPFLSSGLTRKGEGECGILMICSPPSSILSSLVHHSRADPPHSLLPHSVEQLNTDSTAVYYRS